MFFKLFIYSPEILIIREAFLKLSFQAEVIVLIIEHFIKNKTAIACTLQVLLLLKFFMVDFFILIYWKIGDLSNFKEHFKYLKSFLFYLLFKLISSYV